MISHTRNEERGAAARERNRHPHTAEVGGLTSLTTLNLNFCSGLTALPAEVGVLTSLTTLDLSDCSGLTALPDLSAIKGLSVYGRS